MKIISNSREDYLKFIEQQEAVKFNYDRQRAQLEERLQAVRMI